MAWASCKMNQFNRFKFFHACTILLALTFVCIKSYEYHDKFTHYEIVLKNGKFADGHLVKKDLAYKDGVLTGSITIKGHIVDDEKELYDLQARKPAVEGEKAPKPAAHEEHTFTASEIKSFETYG